MHELAHYCSNLLLFATSEYEKQQADAYLRTLETVGVYHRAPDSAPDYVHESSRVSYTATDKHTRELVEEGGSYPTRHTEIELEGTAFTVLLDTKCSHSLLLDITHRWDSQAKDWFLSVFSPLADRPGTSLWLIRASRLLRGCDIFILHINITLCIWAVSWAIKLIRCAVLGMYAGINLIAIKSIRSTLSIHQPQRSARAFIVE